MRKIVLTLTDEEYAALETQAAQERRTPREMAAYLVTRPQYTVQPDWTWYPNTTPWLPTIRSGSTAGVCGCGQRGSHICGMTTGNWVGTSGRSV